MTRFVRCAVAVLAVMWAMPAAADKGVCSSENAVKVGDSCPADITWSGCCQGGAMVWCEQDGSALCYESCGGDAATCSWVGTIDYMGFPVEVNSYLCWDVAEPVTDPSGTYKLECGLTCTAQCENRECGPDKCFGSCGTCTDPAKPECDASGKCVDCAPKCYQKNCGDDGCGGVCGAGCGDNQYCGLDSTKCFDCTCDGKTCGEDGCGNSCGTCENAGDVCDRGTCVPFGCAGRGEGETGCNGCACEECVCADAYCCDTQWDEMCAADCGEKCGGACPCVADCTDRECGDNGCGGTCGSCAEGEACDPDGLCCTPQCDGKQCGDDGCGGDCGTCAEGKVCEADQCVVCTPQCDGKQCGDNGCGGDCGTCEDGKSCGADGTCKGDYPESCNGLDVPSGSDCGAITLAGCCDATGRVVWCDQGLVFCIDCNAAEDPAARTCGWLAEESFYDCGNAGEDPSGANPIACEGGPTCTCEGKNCGDNGCGTSCGVCSPDKVCQAGQCVVVADGTTDGDVPNPGEDVPVVADTGRDTGSTPVDVIAPKDNAGTDTAAGTDTGTGETGEDGGGCNAGAASHSLPLFLMLSAFGAAVLRRRRG